ncbi:hypothetical protein MKEN_01333500 [Mycena kentingensis (nom. inval.)]|nr:hypothetical protein MKEN_01333500 [Mycena kentingensis (nom. inval.)]
MPVAARPAARAPDVVDEQLDLAPPTVFAAIEPTADATVLPTGLGTATGFGTVSIPEPTQSFTFQGPSLHHGKSKGLSTGDIAGIVVCVVAIIAIRLMVWLFYRRRARMKRVAEELGRKTLVDTNGAGAADPAAFLPLPSALRRPGGGPASSASAPRPLASNVHSAPSVPDPAPGPSPPPPSSSWTSTESTQGGHEPSAQGPHSASTNPHSYPPNASADRDAEYGWQSSVTPSPPASAPADPKLTEELNALRAEVQMLHGQGPANLGGP